MVDKKIKKKPTGKKIAAAPLAVKQV